MPKCQLTCCRDCGQTIFWATTDKGKQMPIDEAPDNNAGNVQIWDAGGVTRCRVVGPAQLSFGDTEVRYLAHFATCPVRNQGRQPNRHRVAAGLARSRAALENGGEDV